MLSSSLNKSLGKDEGLASQPKHRSCTAHFVESYVASSSYFFVSLLFIDRLNGLKREHKIEDVVCCPFQRRQVIPNIRSCSKRGSPELR